ncbi:MAG: M20 family metallo-hydrolase [Spirochaetota bacterium]|nr:M20 family metallo-hydrolase [Spirochaetota bacterium]
MQDRIDKKIESMGSLAVELQRGLTERPAVPPNMGGTGEAERAAYLKEWFRGQGIAGIEQFDAPDERVEGGVRPNLIVTLPGKSHAKSVWIISHLDIVPPGERSAWTEDPHRLRQEGDLLYGRGVEDNQQGIVSSTLALLALHQLEIVPEYDLKLMLAADEESGSELGAKYLLDEHPELFGPKDEFIIPDHGSPDGMDIQIAEKSIYSLKFTTTGKQCHAASPQNGINAFVAGSELVVELSSLCDRFAAVSNERFQPPYSTFVPTKKEPNVNATNVLPGEDRFYMNCRILPQLDFEDVAEAIDEIKGKVERKHTVQISWEIDAYKPSSHTAETAPVVTKLQKAVQQVRGGSTNLVGIGGGTIAGDFRQTGRDAVVWSTILNTAHMPDEHCSLRNILADAKVFCVFALSE